MNVTDTLFDSFINGLPSSFDGEGNGTDINNNDGCPSIDDVHGVFSMVQQQCASDDLVGLAGTETASLSSQSSSSSLCDLQEHKHNIGNTTSIVIGSPGEISVKPPAVVSSLENIYHLLFHDIHQLLAESAFDSHSPNHSSSQHQQHARHYQSKRKREISVAPSPAPFDMEAILRAQQEFIQRRQLEETCNDKVRVSCTLPKRSRKRAPTSAQQHL
ncbi:predicted protein [Lichtheimia corymbifera JMRC:FSU:9682]|uniref:Uncharacterized protein n=1 Tax=Lichtheimia corymbifera JMRC:FSU:9682 TaxID=1263082 RepID=A0A068RG04_9FUNG|nr:predicted protein [Lichtheimia corymbifera JMRC:FSU:9682]